ncbi:hypothetical protein [Pseudoalteromonas sp.]|uniref:hypothetical protein n=1 Tax=Pseudoalteromonas sp. TaxID=53249 RepID=UPI003D10B72B
MTPSKYIKSKTSHLKANVTIQMVADSVDKSRQTVANWYKTNRKLLDACILKTIKDLSE